MTFSQKKWQLADGMVSLSSGNQHIQPVLVIGIKLGLHKEYGSGKCANSGKRGELVKMQNPRPPNSGHFLGDSDADGPAGTLWEIPPQRVLHLPTVLLGAELDWIFLILRECS